MGKSRILYGKLNATEKKLYDSILRGLSESKIKLDISGTPRSIDLSRVIGAVSYDNPEYMHIIGSFRYTYRGEKYIDLEFSEAPPPQTIKRMNEKTENAVKAALSHIESLSPLTDYDRLIYLYEFLQDNVVYDNAELDCMIKTGKGCHPNAHTPYGALVEKCAVCDGIAAAFAMISQRMGYQCSLVSGKSLMGGNGFSGHSWNIIKIGKHYYNLDVTWDINLYADIGVYCYNYFCADDADFGVDHEWDLNSTEPCNSNIMSFYRRHRLFVTSIAQLDDVLRRFAGSRAKVIRLRLSDGISIPNAKYDYNGIVERLMEHLREKGESFSITHCWNAAARGFTATIERGDAAAGPKKIKQK